MKNTTKTKCLLTLGALAALVLSGCREKNETGETGSTKGTGALAAVLLSEAPGNALSISEARKDPTPGREITISGEVIGALNPLVEGRALVILGDPTRLTSCNRIPGDTCPTPWDVCCDDPEVVTASIATVQVIDDEGRPLKEGLRGLNGLAELSFLTVTGTVAEGSNADNLLVNATGIHVEKESPFKNTPPAGPVKDHDHENDHEPEGSESHDEHKS